MGYLAEFPHMEANKLNLDWLLEQYSTFNKRIKEIQDHFDEVAAEMASEVNQLEQDFDEFKQTVNNNFSNLSHDIEVQVNAAIADIQRQIDTISNNMAAYIEAHMDEWQTEAIEVLFESDDRYFDNNSTITCDKTFAEVFEAIDNANYKFKLAYIYEDSPEVKETVELTNIQRFGDGTSPSDYIIFEGVKDSYILTVKYDQDGTLRCVKPTLVKNVVKTTNYTQSGTLVVDGHTATFDGDAGYQIGKGTFLVVAKIVLGVTPTTLEAGLQIIGDADTTVKCKAILDSLEPGVATVSGIYLGNTATATIKAQVYAIGTLASTDNFSVDATIIQIA